MGHTQHQRQPIPVLHRTLSDNRLESIFCMFDLYLSFCTSSLTSSFSWLASYRIFLRARANGLSRSHRRRSGKNSEGERKN
uniref:Uncharacterized protein n=1 Tax=Leersia perrieri TaxID=77586 RepID=A0A0D9X8D4_9ORYZ